MTPANIQIGHQLAAHPKHSLQLSGHLSGRFGETLAQSQNGTVGTHIVSSQNAHKQQEHLDAQHAQNSRQQVLNTQQAQHLRIQSLHAKRRNNRKKTHSNKNSATAEAHSAHTDEPVQLAGSQGRDYHSPEYIINESLQAREEQAIELVRLIDTLAKQYSAQEAWQLIVAQNGQSQSTDIHTLLNQVPLICAEVTQRLFKRLAHLDHVYDALIAEQAQLRTYIDKTQSMLKIQQKTNQTAQTEEALLQALVDLAEAQGLTKVVNSGRQNTVSAMSDVLRWRNLSTSLNIKEKAPQIQKTTKWWVSGGLQTMLAIMANGRSIFQKNKA